MGTQELHESRHAKMSGWDSILTILVVGAITVFAFRLGLFWPKDPPVQQDVPPFQHDQATSASLEESPLSVVDTSEYVAKWRLWGYVFLFLLALAGALFLYFCVFKKRELQDEEDQEPLETADDGISDNSDALSSGLPSHWQEMTRLHSSSDSIDI